MVISPGIQDQRQGDRIAYVFSYSVFISLEIMFAAFGLRYSNDFKTVPLSYALGVFSVWRFFP
jgi:hypothetical protein